METALTASLNAGEELALFGRAQAIATSTAFFCTG